jgi:hypothetical protein
MVSRAVGLAVSGAAFLVGLSISGPAQWSVGQFASPAFAVAEPLSSPQASAVEAAVQAALASVNPSLTGTARTQAIQAALAQTTKDMISTYGANVVMGVVQAALHAGLSEATILAAVLPAAVNDGVGVAEAVADCVVAVVEAGGSASGAASTVIAIGQLNSLSEADVAAGLGLAAAILEKKNNKLAAEQIGQTIANEGTSAMSEKFAAVVLQNGGTQDVADAGTGNPVGVTAETTTMGSPTTNTTGTTGTANMSLPPCANPSCS